MQKNETSGERFRRMTETPVRPLILKLAVPSIISMLVTGIYNTADTYFVGRISTQATAAVGLVFSVMAIIQALGFFCGQAREIISPGCWAPAIRRRRTRWPPRALRWR